MKTIACLGLIFSLTFLGGCGYTTKSILAPGIKSICIDNFANGIDLSREITDKRADYSYRPGLETDITRGVIDRFLFNGRLDIKSRENADLVLTGKLTDFRQFPLSYDNEENVEEYRIEIFVEVELSDRRDGKLLWKESSFMGQTSYTVSGPHAKSEEEAIKLAVKDLAVRIVERTVEAW